MVRTLVFGLHAHEYLEFGKGISDTDEPDIWQKDLTGSIEKWIEVGQPEDRRILKACGKAAQVLVYMYSSSAPVWWKQISNKLARARNLTVCQIAPQTSAALEQLCQRSMQLQVTIQDGEIWVRDDSHAVQVEIATVMSPLPA